jgi:TatD DNase family protein
MNSSIKYIDIHSHLNFPDYDNDREEVIFRMKENGIGTITIGTSLESSRSAVEQSRQHENLWAAIGVHPGDDADADFDELEFEKLVQDPKVVAFGECGLDYGKSGVIEEDEKRRQKALFEKQINFASKWNKPLMIHARSSNADILEILVSKKKEWGENLKGNAHFFTGSVDEAKKYFDLDFSISFTGVITFARDYDEVVRFAPLSLIMAETDAPFVSPVPWRGKRNEPSYVIEVVKKIAEIKGQEEHILRDILKENAVAKFGLVC